MIAESSGLLSVLGAKLWVIISVAVSLGFVIFVHELGHFLAAKACGVKCEKFYIGFDVPMSIGPLKLPQALCRFQWGETEYGIGSLPLGGYVKMLGQDDNPAAQARENERIRVRKSGISEADASAAGQATRDASQTGNGDDVTSSANLTSADDDQFELDPRSYPAKPVWQRMIIISAGVVMNLIFAVIFAALAYTMGVRYVPCIIGNTVPDSPAWRQGVVPGDQILQIGRRWSPDEHLRFRRDLLPQVLLNGGEKPMELLIRPSGETQATWFGIQPENRLNEAKRRFGDSPVKEDETARAEVRRKVLEMLSPMATLGITSMNTTELSNLAPAETYRLQDPVYGQLQSGDEIIAVDGVALPRDEETGKIFATRLESILAARMTEPVTVTVRRQAKVDDSGKETAPSDRFDVTLPPCRMNVLGMRMRVGAIAGVRPDSPADVAGLRQGDRLVTIDGQPVGDAFQLTQRLLDLAGKEIEVEYQRDGRQQTVRLKPRLPETPGEPLFYGAMLPIEGLGIALPIDNVVEEVEPDGPAQRAGVMPGDEIVTLQMELADQEQLAKAKQLFPGYDEPVYLDRAFPAWQYVEVMFVQRAVPGTKINLTLLRDSPQPLTVAVTPVESDRWYNASRGLLLDGLTQVRTAKTWSEAWSLGLREAWDSVTQVWEVLRGLVQGRISWRNLGGPVTIATAAGYEASEGFSQLLIFLTLLSANLAVLNFLPIPALDGGHMVFLAAEGIRGKPVDERLQVLLTVMGVVFLLSLIVVLTI
ncbi:MAG: site-2 protease family protein, partial [Planctomycetes bacterium]|nr:site-2 protease family protein [Planctomycetota bacterium]